MGIQEGVSLAAVSMITNALFTINYDSCCKNGNSTYFTLPAAALISLAFFLIVTAVMKKSGADDLSELLNLAFGKTGAALAGLLIVFCLVWAAFLPLSRFVQAMHGLLYEGVSYLKLMMFILPVVLVLSLMGFETIGRTAKCFSILLPVIFFAVVLSAAGGFETYRLYPFLGNGVKEITMQSFTQTFAFLPALTGILIMCGGLNGIKSAEKTGVIAAFISAAVCFIAQFTLGMIYTYTELTELFIPLYRLNHMNILENSLMRLDKLSHMAWLNGSMLGGAFYIYSASELFSELFGLKDIRPAISTNVMVTFLLILMKFSGSFYKIAPLLAAMEDCGFMLIVFTLSAGTVSALIRSSGRTAEGLKV